jgi:methylase of polypeptide subunit release factors
LPNDGRRPLYYAVGMAIRCPTAHVFAFDADINAQHVCLANCAVNGVQQRISVGGAVNPDLLKALTGDVAHRLLIIDCEGYDTNLRSI